MRKGKGGRKEASGEREREREWEALPALDERMDDGRTDGRTTMNGWMDADLRWSDDGGWKVDGLSVDGKGRTEGGWLWTCVWSRELLKGRERSIYDDGHSFL